MNTKQKIQIAAQFIFCSLFAPSLFAVDGVVEINHSCAVQLGCFSGDATLYPVIIDGSAGHSYRLTSDLIVPVNYSGIQIIAANIKFLERQIC